MLQQTSAMQVFFIFCLARSYSSCLGCPRILSGFSCHQLSPAPSSHQSSPELPQPWQWPSQNTSKICPEPDWIQFLTLPCDLFLLWCFWGHHCTLLVPSVLSSCVAQSSWHLRSSALQLWGLSSHPTCLCESQLLACPLLSQKNLELRVSDSWLLVIRVCTGLFADLPHTSERQLYYKRKQQKA